MLHCSWFPRLRAKSRNHQNNVMLVLSFWMPQIRTSGVQDLSESWIEIFPSPATPSTQAADCLRPVGISIVSQGLSGPLIIYTTYEFCPALLWCLSPGTSPSGACGGLQWQSLHLLEKRNTDRSSPLFSSVSTVSTVALSDSQRRAEARHLAQT